MKRIASFLVLLAVFISTPAFASSSNTLQNGAAVLEEILVSPDQNIPERLLANAKGIIIFPTMVKGGFFFGARFGKGVASVRDPKTGQWGPPAFLTTMGGSFGFQFGAEAVDLILLVMSDRGMQGLMKGQFTLGGDIAVAAGPVGRHAEANTDLLFQGEIYSYSRSKGLFGGISLKGAGFSFDDQAIEKYYGKSYEPNDLLSSGTIPKMPESGRRFMKRLNLAAPPAKLPKNF